MIIEISDTGVPRGVIEIVNKLPIPASISEDVTIRFSGDEFIFLTGLVLLATWRKALAPGMAVTLDDTRCPLPNQRFLTNTGFREIIESGHDTPAVQHRIGRVPLRPITNKFVKEATVNEIVSIFDEYAGQVADTNPFKMLLSELCENVLAHSEFVSPGYVCARAFDKSLKAEITIADSGIGILKSYLEGTNDQIKEKIQRGSSALDLAIEGLNSSKLKQVPGVLRSYYGFGLWIARRLIEENGGQLLLVSGNEALHIDQYNRRRPKLTAPWPGTFIALVLDLSNPLPLEKILEEGTLDYVKAPSSSLVVDNIGATNTTVDSPVPNVVSARARDESSKTAHESNVTRLPIKTINLQHYGTELLTRDAGTAIRADLAGYLAAGYGVRVVLDGVSDITPSVADEAFAKLAEIVGHDVFERKVEIIGGSTIAQRLVAFVLQTRRSRPGNG